MKDKRLIWMVIGTMAVVITIQGVRETRDPIPQLAGLGATGFTLLIVSEFAPKLASGFALLLAIAYLYNVVPEPNIKPNFARQGRGSRT